MPKWKKKPHTSRLVVKDLNLTVDDAHKLLGEMYFNCPGYEYILDLPFTGLPLRWHPHACVTSEMYEYLKTFTPSDLSNGFILSDKISVKEAEEITQKILTIFICNKADSKNLLDEFLTIVTARLLPGLKKDIFCEETDTLLIKYQLWGWARSQPEQCVQWAFGYGLFWDALLEWIKSEHNLNQPIHPIYNKFLFFAYKNPGKKPRHQHMDPLHNVYRDHIYACIVCLLIQHGVKPLDRKGSGFLPTIFEIISTISKKVGVDIGVNGIKEIWRRQKIFKTVIDCKVFYLFSVLKNDMKFTSFATGFMCNNFLLPITDKKSAYLPLRSPKSVIKTDLQSWQRII